MKSAAKRTTVGIYGDSFGWEPRREWNVRFGQRFNQPFHMNGCEITWRGWVTDLRQRVKHTHEIYNHCELAASMHYSYNKFLQSHTNYEKIIFLVTAAGRLWLPHSSNITLQHIANINNLEMKMQELKLSHSPDTWPREIYCAQLMYEYHLRLDHDERLMLLMLNDIKALRPDVIFVPCFEPSLILGPQSWEFAWRGPALHRLNQQDREYFGIDNDPTWHERATCNHLSAVMNSALADIFEAWLSKNKLYDARLTWQAPDQDRGHYYQKIGDK
jgi:hypothetical protein